MNGDGDIGLIAHKPEVERDARPEVTPGAGPVVSRLDWLLSPGLLVAVLCAISFTASAWVATTVFDRLPHVEDDVAFLFQAKMIASGHLLARPPSLPDFFQIPFVLIRDGHWFGKYPPGYPMVLAIGVLFGHAWLLNPAVGALDVALVYLIGRRLFDAATGILAAALLVSSPFFLLQSGSFMSHTVTLCWTLLFLLLFESTRRTRSLWRGLLAGGAIGMLFISRPLTAVGIGIPFVIWALVDMNLDARRVREYGTMTLAFVPFVLGMLQYNRMTTGHATHFAYELWWPYDRIGFGPTVGRGGHTLAAGIINMRIDLDQLSHYLFGWPGRLSMAPMILGIALALIALVWRAARVVQRRRTLGPAQSLRPHLVPELWDVLLAGVVVSLVAVHLAYWTPGLMYGPRYYFEAIGAMVLLSSRGILGLATWLAVLLRSYRPRLPMPRLWTTAALLVVVAGLVIWNFNSYAPDRFRDSTDWYNINADGLRTVKAAGISHAVVFVREDQWTDYAPFFSQNTTALNTDVVYAIDLGNENAALMAEYPGRTYYLFAHGTLTQLQEP